MYSKLHKDKKTASKAGMMPLKYLSPEKRG